MFRSPRGRLVSCAKVVIYSDLHGSRFRLLLSFSSFAEEVSRCFSCLLTCGLRRFSAAAEKCFPKILPWSHNIVEIKMLLDNHIVRKIVVITPQWGTC